MGAGCMSHVWNGGIDWDVYYHVNGRVTNSQAPVVNSFRSKMSFPACTYHRGAVVLHRVPLLS